MIKKFMHVTFPAILDIVFVLTCILFVIALFIGTVVMAEAGGAGVAVLMFFVYFGVGSISIILYFGIIYTLVDIRDTLRKGNATKG